MQKHACGFACVTFLVVIAAYAQSDKSVLNKRPTTFHIEGTVSSWNSSVDGVEVKFEGKNITKSVLSNRNGFYRADLPFGFYTMAASLGTGQYPRRFLVTSRTKVVLNVVLYQDPDCDPVFPQIVDRDGTPISREPTQEEYNDGCGGGDSLSIPSRDGSPFELFIHYSNRRRADHGNTYNSYGGGRVFVAYNLFTLLADKVVYNQESQTITARGAVVTCDASGRTQHFDSIIFRIANGDVIAVR